METATLIRAEDVEQFMASVGLPRFNITKLASGNWAANCFWPNGDVARDRCCVGSGSSLTDAITEMLAKVETAKRAAKTLRTPAEVKAAVIDLIREHDAAPASFRDAVDALPVSDR